MTLSELVTLFLSLAGTGALVALAVNVLKHYGVVKDGMAQTWVLGFNVAGLVGLYVLKLARPDLDLAGLDANIAKLAQALALLFELVVQMWSSQTTHARVRGVPVVGTSFSRP